MIVNLRELLLLHQLNFDDERNARGVRALWYKEKKRWTLCETTALAHALIV